MIPMKFASMGGSGGSSFDPANPGPIGGTTPSTAAFTRLSVAQGTLTDPVAGINLTATWNDAADTFNAMNIAVTSTAAGVNSSAFQATINGAGFRIRDNGRFESVDGVGRIEPSFGWVIEGSSIVDFQGNLRLGGNWSGIRMAMLSASHGLQMGANLDAIDLVLRREAAATLQLGITHATTPTAQRIQAHGVGVGTGADLILGGGSGDTKGNVILDGGNRSVYIASPSATEIRDILISHGLMAAS